MRTGFRWFLATTFAATLPAGDRPTFHRDVAPILQKRCQSCHRTGEIGPMPLITYQEARPWAKSIQQAVLARKMPPWSADPSIGRFKNDPSLSPGEIEAIRAWVDAGAPEGDPAEAPKPLSFADGWNIGTPDVVFEMPAAYDVPASGTIEYTYVILPTGFTEDQWVEAAEVRPGNRAVVHHVTALVRTAGSKWLRDYPVGTPFVPAPLPGKKRRGSDGDRFTEGTRNDELIAGYAPGLPHRVFPPGHAILIPAGSDIVLQLHYTANGKAAVDRSRVGFVFSKQPPRRRLILAHAHDASFVIPPRTPEHPVKGSIVTREPMDLVALLPHMHLRGKHFEFRAIYADGRSETLLRVPRYDFNWQHVYELAEPKAIPVGTTLEISGAFDNSANNPHNPDPNAEVRWGDQSWEEMFIGFFQFAISPRPGIDLKDIVPVRPATLSPETR